MVVGGVQILHVHLRPAVDERGWATGYLSTPPLRLHQIQTYCTELAPDPPVIVAGDYNEDPTGTTVAYLHRAASFASRRRARRRGTTCATAASTSRSTSIT